MNAPSPLVLRQTQQASAVGQSVARLLELHAGKVWIAVRISCSKHAVGCFVMQSHSTESSTPAWYSLRHI